MQSTHLALLSIYIKDCNCTTFSDCSVTERRLQMTNPIKSPLFGRQKPFCPRLLILYTSSILLLTTVAIFVNVIFSCMLLLAMHRQPRSVLVSSTTVFHRANEGASIKVGTPMVFEVRCWSCPILASYYTAYLNGFTRWKEFGRESVVLSIVIEVWLRCVWHDFWWFELRWNWGER